MKWNSQSLSAAVILLWLMAAPTIRAQFTRMPTYDFDSMTYEGTVIVEGTLVGTDRVGKDNISGFNVEVTAVHRGDVKIGDVLLVASLDLYRNSNGQPLDFGEHFILFLKHGAGSSTDFKMMARGMMPPSMMQRMMGTRATFARSSSNGFSPVPGGVWVVQGEVIKGFGSRQGMPFFMLGLPGMEPAEKTLEGFHTKIAASVKKADEIAQHLQAKDIATDVPWMLQFLGTRSKDHRMDRMDSLAYEIVERLKRVRDPAALDGVVDMDSSAEWARHLYDGFASQQGQDYLFGKLMDDTVPSGRKVKYADALGRVIRPNPAPSSAGKPATASAPSADYIARLGRLAQMALEKKDDEALSRALTWDAGCGALNLRVGGQGEVPKDARTALAPLRQLYYAAASEDLKYQIEMQMLEISHADYKELDSKCGPILSHARLYKPFGDGQAIHEGKFYYYCDWKKVEKIEVDEGRIILEHLQTHRRLSLPIGLEEQLRDVMQMNYGGAVELPNDFQHGNYRIHMEFEKDGKVISVGHPFEAEL